MAYCASKERRHPYGWCTVYRATVGTARAQYHLRQMFVFLNVFPINQPEVMIGNAAERFDAQGNLTDETTKDFIRQRLRNLVDWTWRLTPPQGV